MCAHELRFRMRNATAATMALGSACLAFASDSVFFDPAHEARAFLRAYAALTATSDVAILELYRDDARLRVSSFAADGQARTAPLRGRDWKRQLRAGWYDGSTRLEATSFRNASIARDGERIVIRANRYSQTRCYCDSKYLVAIEANASGIFQIVEEHIGFQPDSHCASGDERQVAAPAATPVREQTRPVALPRNAIPISNNTAAPVGTASAFHPSQQRR